MGISPLSIVCNRVQVAVNKMDDRTVDWSQARYKSIQTEVRTVALTGYLVLQLGADERWLQGPGLLQANGLCERPRALCADQRVHGGQRHHQVEKHGLVDWADSPAINAGYHSSPARLGQPPTPPGAGTHQPITAVL